MSNYLKSSDLFIHLRVHSSYSLSFGALQIDKIIEFAKNDNQPALCIADNNNMFGALEFSEKAVSLGLQPILGCQINLSDQYGEGEVVILVSGMKSRDDTFDNAKLTAMLREEMQATSLRDAVQTVSQISGQSRKIIYSLAIDLDREN